MTDIPATSTPKKQKVDGHTPSSDSTQILEGRYKGTAYHRDGTRVGWYYYNCSKLFPSKIIYTLCYIKQNKNFNQ